jgi:hypothetical protein
MTHMTVSDVVLVATLALVALRVAAVVL